MSIITLTNLIERLPPGRARTRDETRLKLAGEEARKP